MRVTWSCVHCLQKHGGLLGKSPQGSSESALLNQPLRKFRPEMQRKMSLNSQNITPYSESDFILTWLFHSKLYIQGLAAFTEAVLIVLLILWLQNLIKT